MYLPINKKVYAVQLYNRVSMGMMTMQHRTSVPMLQKRDSLSLSEVTSNPDIHQGGQLQGQGLAQLGMRDARKGV